VAMAKFALGTHCCGPVNNWLKNTWHQHELNSNF